MKEILLNELAKRGVLIPEKGKSLSFDYIMKRLAKVDLLFCKTESHPLTPHFLPMSKPSPFHTYFITHCIEKDQPGILLEYLGFYDLANSLDSLKALIDIKLIEKSWAKLLFQFRFHDDLF